MQSSSSEPSPTPMTFDLDALTEICHNVLVAEIPDVLRLPVSERLELARRRRRSQIVRHCEFERQFQTSISATASTRSTRDSRQQRRTRRRRPDGVRFVGNVALLEAVGRNDIEEVRQLMISKHSNVNDCIVNGLTALHQACIDGHLALVKLLIVQCGANVNVRDTDQWTPLHTAALCGHSAVASLLIDRGADLLAINADGFMPYDLCEDESTLDVIESAMAKRGVTQETINELRFGPEKAMLCDLQRLSRDQVDLDFTGHHGETPLHVAASNGYVEVAEYLLSRLVPIDSVDSDTWQPIHCAAYWRQVPMIELLVRHGASLDTITSDNKTPIDLCPDETIRHWLSQFKAVQDARKTANVQPAASTTMTVESHKYGLGLSTASSSFSPDLLSPTAAIKSINPRVDGSHNSLYNSNLSLAEKSLISSSMRRLAGGHDKELEMQRKDARGEADLWTSMQSLLEVDEDDQHESAASTSQYQTPCSTAAVNTRRDDITGSTQIRQTMMNALHSTHLSDDQRIDLILMNDFNSLQRQQGQAEITITHSDKVVNWEFKPKNITIFAAGDNNDRQKKQRRDSKSTNNNDKKNSTSRKKHHPTEANDAARNSTKLASISKSASKDDHKTSVGRRKSDAPPSTTHGSNNGAAVEVLRRTLSEPQAADNEPSRGTTSAEMKKRRSEQRQQLKQPQHTCDTSVTLANANGTRSITANDELTKHIVKQKDHRCIII